MYINQSFGKSRGVRAAAASLLLAALIVRADRQAAARLLPTGAYAPTRLRAIYLVIALLVIGSTVEIFVPYFLQTILGHEPLMAGYLTAVMAGGWSFGSMLSAGRAGAFGACCIRLGPALMSVSLAALAWLLQQPAEFAQGAGFGVLCVVLAGVGLGIGLAWPHLLTNLLDAAPAAEGALASSSISTVQLYAMSLGAAVAGWVANAAGLGDPGGVPGAPWSSPSSARRSWAASATATSSSIRRWRSTPSSPTWSSR